MVCLGCSWGLGFGVCGGVCSGVCLGVGVGAYRGHRLAGFGSVVVAVFVSLRVRCCGCCRDSLSLWDLCAVYWGFWGFGVGVLGSYADCWVVVLVTCSFIFLLGVLGRGFVLVDMRYCCWSSVSAGLGLFLRGLAGFDGLRWFRFRLLWGVLGFTSRVWVFCVLCRLRRGWGFGGLVGFETCGFVGVGVCVGVVGVWGRTFGFLVVVYTCYYCLVFWCGVGFLLVVVFSSVCFVCRLSVGCLRFLFCFCLVLCLVLWCVCCFFGCYIFP